MKVSKSGIIFLLLCALSCTAVFFHDRQNPCQSNRKEERSQWKTEFPKEYKAYKKRVSKDSLNKLK